MAILDTFKKKIQERRNRSQNKSSQALEDFQRKKRLIQNKKRITDTQPQEVVQEKTQEAQKMAGTDVKSTPKAPEQQPSGVAGGKADKVQEPKTTKKKDTRAQLRDSFVGKIEEERQRQQEVPTEVKTQESKVQEPQDVSPTQRLQFFSQQKQRRQNALQQFLDRQPGEGLMDTFFRLRQQSGRQDLIESRADTVSTINRVKEKIGALEPAIRETAQETVGGPEARLQRIIQSDTEPLTAQLQSLGSVLEQENIALEEIDDTIQQAIELKEEDEANKLQALTRLASMPALDNAQKELIGQQLRMQKEQTEALIKSQQDRQERLNEGLNDLQEFARDKGVLSEKFTDTVAEARRRLTQGESPETILSDATSAVMDNPQLQQQFAVERARQRKLAGIRSGVQRAGTDNPSLANAWLSLNDEQIARIEDSGADQETKDQMALLFAAQDEAQMEIQTEATVQEKMSFLENVENALANPQTATAEQQQAKESYIEGLKAEGKTITMSTLSREINNDKKKLSQEFVETPEEESFTEIPGDYNEATKKIMGEEFVNKVEKGEATFGEIVSQGANQVGQAIAEDLKSGLQRSKLTLGLIKRFIDDQTGFSDQSEQIKEAIAQSVAESIEKDLEE